MAHRLNQMQTPSGEHPLVIKYPSFMYTASKQLRMQLPDEKDSIIAKWAAWISNAQLCGYMISILGWIMCITSTAIDQWRIWYVENVPGVHEGTVWIGIWRICYMNDTDPKGLHFICMEFSEKYKTLPSEIFLAQDLMSLGCMMGAVAICFMTFGLWNVFKTITQKTFLLTFFSLGGILNLLSGIMVSAAISWNLYSVLARKGIHFSENFRMPSSPKKQWPGPAIYVGYIAAVLFLLSSFLILCNKCTSQTSEPSFLPSADELTTVEVSSQLCAACQSAVAINIENRMLSESSANELSSNSGIDVNKCDSKSIQSQLSENVNSHTIIFVTPYK